MDNEELRKSGPRGAESHGSGSEDLAGHHKPPDVPPQRYDLLILQSIRRIIRAVDLYSRKLKLRCQLTAPQLITLLYIAEAGETTVTAIAKAVFVSPSTVVGILDRLQHRGLVERSRDLGDRRVVRVRPTQAAFDLLKAAPSPLQDGLAEALDQLSEQEQATIARSLKRIVDLMEAGYLEAAPILETDQPDLQARQDAQLQTKRQLPVDTGHGIEET